MSSNSMEANGTETEECESLRTTLKSLFHKYLEAENFLSSTHTQISDLGKRKEDLELKIYELSSEKVSHSKKVSNLQNENESLMRDIRRNTIMKGKDGFGMNFPTRKRSISDQGSTEALISSLRSPRMKKKKKMSKRLRQATPGSRKREISKPLYLVSKSIMNEASSIRKELKRVHDFVNIEFDEIQREIQVVMESIRIGGEDECEKELERMRKEIEDEETKYALKTKVLLENLSIINCDNPMMYFID